MRFSFPSPIISARSSINTAGSKAKNNARAFLALGLLLFGTAAAHAQSAFDGFDPNANAQVRVVVVQPDGKILIGGDFTTLAGGTITRNYIARLNPDNTLDTTFNPNADFIVYAIALQADGKILVGGAFSNIGGQPRNHIARLDPTTGVADSFNPNANGQVKAIAVQSDGKILAGGGFVGANSIGGQGRNYIARLDPTTGAADSFNPNANGQISVITLQGNGKILAGGGFNGASSIGGQARNFIARLDPTTGAADAFNPSADASVNTIALQADSRILAGGVFASIGGQARNFIARLDPATGMADSFDPHPSGAVVVITVQADGKILAGGDFNGTNSIGGQRRNYIARLDPVTGAADSWDPNADNSVNAITVQSDGKILVGGLFMLLTPNSGINPVQRHRIARLETDGRLDRTLDTGIPPGTGSNVVATALQADGKILMGGLFLSINTQTRHHIARLNTDGTLDTAFDPNTDSEVDSIAVQTDGKILVGGAFTSLAPNGGAMVTRNRIARLNPDGTLDTAFNPSATGSPIVNVNAIAVQADGKILVGGRFTGIGGQPRSNIARVDATTGLADSFDPNANSYVYSIAMQADGKILVGGDFSTAHGAITIGGQTRNRIARLDATTGLADSFDPNAINSVDAIAVQADGKILVGGGFFDQGTGAITIGGQSRNDIARLDANTGLADSFNPNANSAVSAIVVQADGKVLAGGGFSSIGGQTRNFIARLDPNTGLADSFNPNANNGVNSIALQSDGKILVGGAFTGNGSITIGGQSRNYFARLTNNTAALQNLSATQTAVTWTRGGSSAQFARVTFESSNDNVNYTFLGNGTATGSNWSLTGLNLATGQNIYIRARGYHRSGDLNGSESITESVRNAYLNTLPQLTTAVSRKTHGTAGDFDILLPLTGEPGVECRSTGGTHTLIFTFSNNVVSGNASVTTGTGSVSGSPTFVSNTMTVNLTGVADVQKITVTLSGVTDSFAQVLPNTAVSMNLLVGDTNGNKTVNATDVAQTKAQSGVAVTASNFRQDMAVNGSINGSDVALVKSRSGQSVP